MKQLKLRKYPDPFLTRPSKKIKNVKVNHIRTSVKMHELMIKEKGLGLAAPQAGVEFSVIVINTIAFDRENGVKRTMFNPEIVEVSEDLFTFKEGCLSFPDKFIEINRPEIIVVKYLDVYNNETLEEFRGVTSICIQHEIDHLNGKLFIEYEK